MDAPAFVKLIEDELLVRGISKGEFYKRSGVSSATFSQWRKGTYSPSSENIRRIEEYLGTKFELGAKVNPAAQQGSGEIPEYATLSEESKLKVKEYVRLLAMSERNG